MIKTLVQKLWFMRVEFYRYFVVGIIGLMVDMGTLWLFIDKFHWSAILSLMINQFIVLTFIFYLNKFWAFKSNGQTRKEVQRYLTLYFFNYIIAIVWMWLWHNKFGFEPKLVRLVNIILAVSWNFLLYKFFVYNSKNTTVDNLSA
ncbi:MAG: hypothetical protein ACD_72C00465G0003 [uncultured bacterium]|nr:MAG: hypothetical protein ACD_72C00465G0003 [uncultured bacterium]